MSNSLHQSMNGRSHSVSQAVTLHSKSLGFVVVFVLFVCFFLIELYIFLLEKSLGFYV